MWVSLKASPHVFVCASSVLTGPNSVCKGSFMCGRLKCSRYKSLGIGAFPLSCLWWSAHILSIFSFTNSFVMYTGLPTRCLYNKPPCVSSSRIVIVLYVSTPVWSRVPRDLGIYQSQGISLSDVQRLNLKPQFPQLRQKHDWQRHPDWFGLCRLLLFSSFRKETQWGIEIEFNGIVLQVMATHNEFLYVM